jgi:hypothetical protein
MAARGGEVRGTGVFLEESDGEAFRGCPNLTF